ncbi:hypothetical protein J437_LFUL003818 [Ladona fulva]|uniref:PiggyBac transposable element-derived protein domain-containing protein n=1 Tax=Ladona fulva TaxID=123851 RepID=A0A8K0P689_LADFU|nr:hypothetical protein J437_LFUL003818 [Ladona fulva]
MTELFRESIKRVLIEVTEEQAFDSDCGGDSDAEDRYTAKLRSPQKSCDSLMPSTSGYSRRKVRKESTDDSASVYSSDTEEESSVSDNDVPEPLPIDTCESSYSDSDEERKEKRDELNFKWFKKSRNHKAFSNSSFKMQTGPKIFPQNIFSPISFVNLILTEVFLSHIVSESNNYASQCDMDLGLTVAELKAWLGIIIYMGFHHLPNV